MTEHTGHLERLEKMRTHWCEPVLSMLLVVQCITIFGLVPATAMDFSIPQSVVAVLPLTFSSIVIITSRGHWSLFTGLAALLLSGVVALLEHWQVNKSVAVVEDLVAIATFGLLSAVVFKAVYGPGRFTGHRVRGAVVLYLNVGLLFTLLYRVIAALSPGAYSNLPDDEHQAALRAALEYFSFANLTSLGAGDILPIQPMARGMSVLEAAIGHLFPATLLARAVMRAMQGEGK